MLSLSLVGQLLGFEGAVIEAATLTGLAAFGLVPYIVLGGPRAQSGSTAAAPSARCSRGSRRRPARASCATRSPARSATPS